VLRLSELRPRLQTGVERLEFHGYLLITQGRCAHEVDFERLSLRAGSLVHVRPGQVQRWRLREGVDGLLLIFEPDVLFPAPRGGRAWRELEGGLGFDEAAWPVHTRLLRRDRAAAERWMRRLERSLVEAAGSPLARPLVRHLLAAALIDVARRLPFSSASKDATDRARRLREDVERSFRVTRNVQDYATRWGVSVRTVDRLSREAFGLSAKELIDARVVLEARRLLAHTSLPIATIGESLGFSEATNFGKFFLARTGERPGAFRARQT
jgi:AraC-like DNA-binding protein